MRRAQAVPVSRGEIFASYISYDRMYENLLRDALLMTETARPSSAPHATPARHCRSSRATTSWDRLVSGFNIHCPNQCGASGLTIGQDTE